MSFVKSKVNTSSNSVELENNEFFVGIEKENTNFLLSILTELYSNPGQAMMREVISNAVDANTGERPVEVEKSGDTDDRTITVEDFGSGMTEEQLCKNYLTYVNSSKTYDFDSVGAFGLGGKSPLACVDSFQIRTTAKENGKYVTTVAEMSKRDNRIIAEILSSTEKKNGTTGTKITIPHIKENMFVEADCFVTAVLKTAKNGKIDSKTFSCPKEIYSLKIENDTRDIELRSIEPINTGSFPCVYGRYTTHQPYIRAYARINDVIIYPLYADYTIKKLVDREACYPFYIIDIDAGEFKFAPSREELPEGEVKEKFQQLMVNIATKYEELKQEKCLQFILDAIENGEPCGTRVDLYKHLLKEGNFELYREINKGEDGLLDYLAGYKKDDDVANLFYRSYIKGLSNSRLDPLKIATNDIDSYDFLEEISRHFSRIIDWTPQNFKINLFFVKNVKKNLSIPDPLKRSRSDIFNCLNVFVKDSDQNKKVEAIYSKMAEIIDVSFVARTVDNKEFAKKEPKAKIDKNLLNRECLFFYFNKEHGSQKAFCNYAKSHVDDFDSNWYVAKIDGSFNKYKHNTKDLLYLYIAESVREHNYIFVHTLKEKKNLIDNYGLKDIDELYEELSKEIDEISWTNKKFDNVFEYQTQVFSNLFNCCTEHYKQKLKVDKEKLPPLVKKICERKTVSADNVLYKDVFLNEKVADFGSLLAENREVLIEYIQCFAPVLDKVEESLESFKHTRTYRLYGETYYDDLLKYDERENFTETDLLVEKTILDERQRVYEYNAKVINDNLCEKYKLHF